MRFFATSNSNPFYRGTCDSANPDVAVQLLIVSACELHKKRSPRTAARHAWALSDLKQDRQNRYWGVSNTSPPCRDPMARQAFTSTVFATPLTDPSMNEVCAIPG